jgi:enterochelin esterase-like enzyme
LQRPAAASGGATLTGSAWVAASVAGVVLFLAGGALGTYRYVWNYWTYRGFSPTHDPAYVATPGTVTTLHVASAALGGRRQEVVVYLPSGYASHPARRYPVLYLLHGSPGTPHAFLHELRMGVLDDVYTALQRAQPLILVMPFGSTGQFTDEEWANGYRRHQDWETFLARDVVRAVDSRFRTIAEGSGRALAGLSEGGYGALNVGLHHPGEFGVLESWSGYANADPIRSIFGTSRARFDWNSPSYLLPRVARSLRRDHTCVWLYTGSSDRLRPQNAAFARSLAKLHIRHRYFVVEGGHEWAVWRRYASDAYLFAARHLHG